MGANVQPASLVSRARVLTTRSSTGNHQDLYWDFRDRRDACDKKPLKLAIPGSPDKLASVQDRFDLADSGGTFRP
jgi:hypothetical protein